MLIDAASLLGSSVRLSTGQAVAKVDALVFDATQVRLAGFQVSRSGVLKKFAALGIDDILLLEHGTVVVDDTKVFESDLKLFDQLREYAGKVIGVKAKTESGHHLGHVTDVCFDEQSGHITRFYLRDFLSERIVPRQFLVSITPKAVVFKDVVGEPIFDHAVAAEAPAGV